MKKLNVLLIIFCSLIFLIFPSVKIQAEEYYFQEEFNQERPQNSLDTDKWTVYPNNQAGVTTIKETGGNLILSQTNYSKFPFVITKNQVFPDGDFSAEIKFQYTAVTGYGTGIALSDKDPVSNPNVTELIRIDVWQDRSLNNMRLEYNGQIIFTSLINTNPHIFRVEKKGLKYLVFLDNNLIFTSNDTLTQTKYLWMGNYVTVPAGAWSKFNVDYIRIKSSVPVKTPIIIVPGIAASFNFGVWTDKGDTGWKWMLMADSSWRQFIDSLEKAGYQKNKDYFIAFYDWRKTNDWTDSDPGAGLPAKKYLAETIDRAKNANPGISKVNVIAHSLGGLVVKSYVESPNYRGDIDKAFLVGSPNNGSIFAYYTWEGAEVPPNWDPVSKSALNIIIKFLSINFNEEPQQMIHNHMKGIKDLLPVGYDYIFINNNPINWLDMQEINTFLNNTSKFQDTSNIFTGKGVKLTNISGIGQTTWEKIQAENYLHQYLWKDGKPMGSFSTADGDNTVLASSSNLPGAEQLTVASTHANLPNSATSLIFNKLGINYTPSNLAGAPNEVLVAWVASPVTLTVKDNSGNSVGELLTDPETDRKWVFVENPIGDYKINLTGTGNGEYHVGADYYTDTKTESSQTQGTAVNGAELNYNLHLDPQNPQPLNLQPEDKIPPTTNSQIQGTQGNNNWYVSDVNISLIASDNAGGTGVDKIEYSFDNTNWQKYEIPIAVSQEGITSIYYHSYDLVNNQEQTQKIDLKIDKTAPVISLSTNPQELWPPNKKMVDVKILGNAFDNVSGIFSKTFSVSDEYQKIQPVISDFNQIIKLEVWREGNDKDGRVYIIKVFAEDQAGNRSEASTNIIVPHDRR